MELYGLNGDYEKAFGSFSKALEMQKTKLGENHPEVAETFRGLGLVHRAAGEHEKAIEFHFKGTEDPQVWKRRPRLEVAVIFHSLGNVFVQ